MISGFFCIKGTKFWGSNAWRHSKCTRKSFVVVIASGHCDVMITIATMSLIQTNLFLPEIRLYRQLQVRLKELRCIFSNTFLRWEMPDMMWTICQISDLYMSLILSTSYLGHYIISPTDFQPCMYTPTQALVCCTLLFFVRYVCAFWTLHLRPSSFVCAHPVPLLTYQDLLASLSHQPGLEYLQ